MDKQKLKAKVGLKSGGGGGGSSPEQKNNPRRNLLCFDIGGARSLTSLYILDRLMDEIWEKERRPGDGTFKRMKPYQYFDMIAGCGSGGLIAIMLGRLNMDVEDCIDEFMKFVRGVYSHMDPHKHPGLQSKSPEEKYQSWKHFAAENGKRMEDLAKDLVRRKCGNEDLLFYDGSDSICEVFVPALVTGSSQPIQLRSYTAIRTPRQRQKHLKVWQAMRATTATPPYFEPMSYEWDHMIETLASGDIFASNPIQLLWNEAKELFDLCEPTRRGTRAAGEPPTERDVGTIISIGSGLNDLEKFEGEVPKLMKSLYKFSSDVERLHDDFQRSNTKLDLTNRFVRLNVVRGMSKIKFYHATQENIQFITAAANHHIGTRNFEKQLESTVHLMQHRAEQDTFAQVAEQYR